MCSYQLHCPQYFCIIVCLYKARKSSARNRNPWCWCRWVGYYHVIYIPTFISPLAASEGFSVFDMVFGFGEMVKKVLTVF